MISHYFGLTSNVIEKPKSKVMIINLATFFSSVIEAVSNS